MTTEKEMTMTTIKFSQAAQQNIEETGIDPQDDLRRLRAKEITSAELIAECLAGADDDREDGWRAYVAALTWMLSAEAAE